MFRPKLPFKFFGISLSLILLGSTAFAAETATHATYSKRASGLYRDISDQNIYYEGLQYFHLERFYRRLLGQRKRALDVNVYDEVPDSTFFTNRHGRSRSSAEELKRGPSVTSGPDLSARWTITKGKFDGITPGFFIKDAKGDRYLLKFDPVDSLELATGAEAVSSRFMYAIGYNIPQYTIVSFKKDQFAIAPEAKVYDETGFRKKLTPERLEQFLLFVAQAKDGSYRASASRVLQGEVLGPMKFQGRRKEDPEDLINHEDRREIRTLQVFNAWINNNDVRESNSLDVIEEKEGRRQIRHYLIDYNSSLGATPRGPKPPQFGHEYMLDYGETLKTILSLGLWKKPWQKRWDEAGRETPASAVGYFDNRYFEPGKFKTQLPHFAFKDLTRADAFWAAKILKSFTDDEIREVVSTGEYSDPKVREEIARILIERRDLISRYGFEESNPLDDFKLLAENDSYELTFEDLAVRDGFVKEGTSTYHFEVIATKDHKGKRVAQEETREKSFKLDSNLLNQYPSLDLLIRTRRDGAKTWSPWVRVEIRQEAGKPHLAGILHQD